MNLAIQPTDSPETAFCRRVLAYMIRRGDRVANNPGEVNIIYVEGLSVNLQQNPDRDDHWNDVRLLIKFHPDGAPYLAHRATATTEPGRSATNSAAAARNGGVARLQLIQYQSNWKVGYHKEWKRLKKAGIVKTVRDTSHPALVQVGEILVYRDADRNMKRTGDPISPASGINQHSTHPDFSGLLVGAWSEGCLVGWHWQSHLRFIDLIKQDPRYIANPDFAFDTTLIGADALFLEKA